MLAVGFLCERENTQSDSPQRMDHLGWLALDLVACARDKAFGIDEGVEADGKHQHALQREHCHSEYRHVYVGWCLLGVCVCIGD